jgi:hypothetical protein
VHAGLGVMQIQGIAVRPLEEAQQALAEKLAALARVAALRGRMVRRRGC